MFTFSQSDRLRRGRGQEAAGVEGGAHLDEGRTVDDVA